MDAVTTATQWLGVALTAGAAACAMAALAMRSAYAMVVCLAGASALGSGALLAAANGDGALGLAIFGVALAPVLMMGGILLSAQAARRGRGSLVGVFLALAALAPIGWASADLRTAPTMTAAPLSGSGLWLAALVFVTACTCVGLLAYGERGIMQRREGEFE